MSFASSFATNVPVSVFSKTVMLYWSTENCGELSLMSSTVMWMSASQYRPPPSTARTLNLCSSCASLSRVWKVFNSPVGKQKEFKRKKMQTTNVQGAERCHSQSIDMKCLFQLSFCIRVQIMYTLNHCDSLVYCLLTK